MTKRRHSYIAFYTSDWLGGTAMMSRLVRSVYHDICLYNWDKNEPASPSQQMLMLADLDTQGPAIVNALVEIGKLVRTEDGSVYSQRALDEAAKAYGLWVRKSEGGKKGAKTTNGTPAGTEPGEPDQDPEPEPKKESGGKPPSPETRGGEAPGGGEEKKEETPPKPRKSYDLETIAQAWNDMAAKNKLGQVVKMTEERQKKLRARLDEYTQEQILEAIALVPDRPFLMGVNDRGWKADFDWLVRPNSVTKVLEGEAYRGAGGKRSGWLDG